MSNNNPSRRIDPSIVAALIGVLGTIVVTLITLFYSNRPGPQPTPFPPSPTAMPTSTITDTAVPTTTVAPGEATSTPAPETPTPELTFTPAPPAIGADWANGCISALWKPYPSDIQPDQINGCLSQPVIEKFYTSSGRLAFTYVGRVGSAQISGLFAQLPSDGTVSLSVLLTEVTNGEVLMGIFAEPDPTSNGMLLVFPAGNNVKKQKVIFRTMPNGNIFSQSTLEANPPIYDAFLDFNGGTVSVKLMKNQINLGSVPVLSPNKWLFIGYQVFSGSNRLQAEFYSPIIQTR